LRDWRPVVQAWHDSPAGQALVRAVDARLAAGGVIYPADPLRALRSTALADTRVVILGQDPYHGPGQAEGLAFSVPAGVPLPPSLRNIAKELQRDLGCALPLSGSLQAWAGQGVLLLNTCLTVEQGQAGSHARLGWQALTDALVAAAAAAPQPKVFLLWGVHAQAQAGRIAAAGGEAHAVLMANHPSPLSALRPPVPFIGCGHFGQANRLLRARGRGEIRWDLVNSESVV
jgi:uracil-DNA glycosylase